ncbi:CRISPR-associated endoribonuclease Cas6 [Peptoclostridium litorale DSM 5388]|uniref:CRISPR associated protein Cas6 C-terminal domain-containing protein n=1 Tax=Peptoclostridium litorale DSM 5388 TaxID=1121324 RepID=A0A069RNF9_PEPLI|nr:CRISPR-associated endoribonuclease Cas6 [Peptoclostridium litorale]KDR95722.1 hypothetical protein CLIT_10c04490 [Peptoclostridium litorale DSM 5388]SIO22600.1 CRISPR-associated endoribonuclease Cas6 [Peptoclostridium litorale DSM 5388]
MRYELTFKLKENHIDLEYRKIIMSFFKSALTDHEGGKYFDLFYGHKDIKNFTFGVFFNKPKFNKDTIELVQNDFKVLISTSDKKMGLALFNSALNRKYIPFKLSGGNEMQFVNAVIKKEKTIDSTSRIFKICSPICVREHVRERNKDYYHSIESAEFIKRLKEIIKNQLKNQIDLSAGDMQIVPIDCRKTVIKHNGIYIESTIGKIAINADEIVLNEIYKNGIGSRKSSGFGLLEVID